jgi:hypothetical protein
MARRTRAFLIDNTIGKVFTNIRSTSESNASNLIAGTKLLAKGFAAKTTTVAAVANNIGLGTGLILSNSGGLIDTITISLKKAATGTPFIINVKKGDDYTSATSVGTYQLASGSKTTTANVNISFEGTDLFFVDITQVGSTVKGTGFAIKFNYYSL